MSNELNLYQLDKISAGTRNSDNPRFQVFLKAFNEALEAGRAAANLELARSQGCLGPTIGKI